MLPPPAATQPVALPVAQPPRAVTGPMPNKGRKLETNNETADLLKCTPCNLNFKTKKVILHLVLPRKCIIKECHLKYSRTIPCFDYSDLIN